MAGRLKFPYICLSIFLLVLPLVCGEDEENNGKNEMEELLQNLLKAEKERRQLSDDTNAKSSRGTEQRYANDDGNVPEIKIQKLSDAVYENDVLVNNDMTQKIIKDCENKYELLLYKDLDSTGGSCYLHKMNDRIYQNDCEGISAEAEAKSLRIQMDPKNQYQLRVYISFPAEWVVVDTNTDRYVRHPSHSSVEEFKVVKITIDYHIGNVIENRTLLSRIKGIDGCTGRTVFELIEASVKAKGLDEYEKRLADRRGCRCTTYEEQCTTVCAEKTGWWWGEKCIRMALECKSVCRYRCR